MGKNVDDMSCDELKAEIIRMLNEIDDEEILEKIYHFVLKIFKLEKQDKQEKCYGGKKTEHYCYAHEHF